MKNNVFFIGNPESKVLKDIFQSKYLNKLYTNFELENAVDVGFNTFKELARKCKALKVDIVIVDDEKMILQGIADVLRKHFVNCIALNSYWTQLILSNKFAHDMLKKYGIKTPEVFMYPKEFPLVIRANGVVEYANSLQELISIRNKIADISSEVADSVFLERFIKGQEYSLTSLFDGKHLITFPVEGLSEIQISEYNSKLEKMFVSQNPEFIGFINSKVILEKQTLYNIGFNISFPNFKEDLLFILINAIYQKLNEITI